MLSAVGALIPIAVAAAISTIPILTVIGLLLSREKRGSAISYLFGWVIGLFVLSALFSLGLSTTSPSTSTRATPTFGVAETVIGLLLVAFGLFLIARRRKPHAGTSWIDKLTGIGPLAAFGVGVLLNLRAKALLLAAAAGLAIYAAQPSLPEALIALAIYTTIASSTVATPVILSLLRPTQMEPRLRRTHDWIQPNQPLVTAIVLIMAGAVITGNGLTHIATLGS